MIKAKIDIGGRLFVKRGSSLKGQWCPYNDSCQCGDWCPLLLIERLTSKVVVHLCIRNIKLHNHEFLDERQ